METNMFKYLKKLITVVVVAGFAARLARNRKYKEAQKVLQN